MTRLIQYKRTMPADLETPVGIYLKIRDLYPQSALLESSDYHTRHNAESFVGVNPIGGFKVVGDRIIIERPGEAPVEKPIAKGVDVVDELTAFMRGFEIVGADTSLPDGLLGYTAYDAVRYFEEGVDITRPEAKFAEIPDINYILYRYIIVINHFKNEMTVVENCPDGSAESIDSIIGVLGGNVAQYPFAAFDDKESSMTDADFIKAVERCTEASHRGDVFQIVPSCRLRAMQIIDETEPHSRKLYGGCIGYLGFNGDINQAITIRSFLSFGKRLYSQAGAGIVARSNPESELQETRNKLGALAKAITYATQFGR